MNVSPGTRLGPYEIESAIGAGGMGEVFRARDTRLERTVAIKILPAIYAGDPQFRARFEREARAISQLEDPHICSLYDVGEEQGVSFIVMQYLEGETLASRLSRGALPIHEALTTSIQIASALDRAHRAGIVHRDLKPGNIMLTRSGAKLLDFGLAKAGASAATAATMLPTTPPALTTQGSLLGTFQYMAPEQVEGQEADARSDIFAFGAVLYEMVTGRPAFQGKTQASLIGAILRDDPTTTIEVAPMIPPALARAIKTCLAKNPDDRFQTAHDVMLHLKWVQEGGSQAGVPAPVAARRRWRERGAWVVAGVGVVAAAALAAFVLTRPTPKPRLMRFQISSPPDVISIDTPRVSPDGQYIAFNATDMTGITRVWLRPMNALDAHPLTGTEGAARPFWSPDSKLIGFMADGRLKKIDVGGGPAQKVCDAPTGSDGSWSPDGVILFDGRATDPIQRCPAGGGVASVALKADQSRKETAVGWPEFLPDGKHFIYLATAQRNEDWMYRVGLLDSTDSQPLSPAQTQAAYAAPGYLLFARDQSLVAQAFDLKTFKLTGQPIPLAERVGTDAVGLARVSASRDGTLVYRTGESGLRLVWVDRSGKDLEELGDSGLYSSPVISPGGDRVAFVLADARTGKSDLWIRDLARGVNSRFTFAAGNNINPVWSPDGGRVIFGSDRKNITAVDLYEKPSSGQGAETLVFESNDVKSATDWSRDGQYVVFQARSPKTGWDVWALPLRGDRKPMPVTATMFAETSAKFSPDGRYVAFASDESGRQEVYVQTFPEANGRWQVSANGGADPMWRGDGRELYYRTPDQRLAAVDVTLTPSFQAGLPHALFVTHVPTFNMRNKITASSDGQKFLQVSLLGRDSLTPTTVVLNWFADLQK